METISIEEWLDLCVKYGCWAVPYYDICDKTLEEVETIVNKNNRE